MAVKNAADPTAVNVRPVPATTGEAVAELSVTVLALLETTVLPVTAALPDTDIPLMMVPTTDATSTDADGV